MAEFPVHLRSIILSQRELVEFADGTRLVDVDPQDKKGQLDYYTVNQTKTGGRFPTEAVYLKGSPPLAKLFAEKESKNRTREATDSEEARARQLFELGKKIAEEIRDGFEQVVRGNLIDKNKIILGSPPGFQLLCPYKSMTGKEQQAILYWKPAKHADGIHSWTLTAVSLNADGIKVTIDRPEYLQAIEPSFLDQHQKLLVAAGKQQKKPTKYRQKPKLKPFVDFIP